MMFEKIKIAIFNLKSFKWSLWFSLCALALVPAIYQTIRTFLISTNTSSSGIDIIGQMEWYDLIDETIKAFLIIPLYSILNKIFKREKDKSASFIFQSLLIVFILYFIFNIGIFIYGNSLISFMNPQENDISTISKYLKLETIAFMIGIIPSFFNVVFVVVEKPKNVYIFLFIKVVLGIVADFLLIPSLGVNGIAISNIITNSILSIAGFVVLYLEKLIKLSLFKKSESKEYLSWLKIGLFSGTQQFIDNIVYALMIGRMVNMVSEQGNYWVANNFIWGWLLIPVTALAEIVKTDCKDKEREVVRSNYYLLSIFIFIFWAITIPAWKPFLAYAQKLENANHIFEILLKLVPFYIAYTLCIISDSIFIGNGKTYLNAINSVLVNFVYYGIWFILFKTNSITFTIDIIIIMFGFGMVFHMIISFIEQWWYDKKFSEIALCDKANN